MMNFKKLTLTKDHVLAHLQKYWFNLACFLIVFVSLYTALSINTGRKIKALPTIAPTPTPSDPLCTTQYKNQSDFVIEQNIIKMSDVKSFKQLNSGGESFVVASDADYVQNRWYSPKLHKIINLVRTTENGEKIDIVYLNDTDTGVFKEIYRLKEVYVEGSEYTKEITDVSFSDDSSMIAITTGESLVIYHTDSETSETLFQEKKNSFSIGGVFAYTVPFNWPINGKIILNEGYYEGSGASVFDMNSKTKKSFHYSLYAYGQKILGVYQDDLVVSDVQPTDPHTSSVYFSKIYRVNIDTQQKRLIQTLSGSVYTGKVTKDGKLYFIKTQQQKIEKYMCSNESKPYQIETTISALMKMDLETGVTNELLQADSTQSTNEGSNDMTLYDLLVNNNNNDREIMLTVGWGQVPVKFLMNESNPKVLTQIN